MQGAFTNLLMEANAQEGQEVIEEAPESKQAWERWWQELSKQYEPQEDILLVGHHPTMEMLLQCYGPTPCSISRRNFAVALVLRLDPDGRYTITHAWPGRLSLA